MSAHNHISRGPWPVLSRLRDRPEHSSMAYNHISPRRLDRRWDYKGCPAGLRQISIRRTSRAEPTPAAASGCTPNRPRQHPTVEKEENRGRMRIQVLNNPQPPARSAAIGGETPVSMETRRERASEPA
ncbi:uncharacterized protein LOC123318708 [Coccinella septempunctata]|uniref:uncharacterized protein LOC123318708 n=1 Tax=Coccinella septempunctata TaxID=41139 RepID=UPI001D0979D5|nr:uncharacterized protein LOC123318708 [Coccinella septempunctata]